MDLIKSMPRVTLWWTARRQSSTHWISTGWSSGLSYLPLESPQHTKWAEAGSCKYPAALLQGPSSGLPITARLIRPELRDGSPAVSRGRWRELSFPQLPRCVMLFCIPKGPVLSDFVPFVWKKGLKSPHTRARFCQTLNCLIWDCLDLNQNNTSLW